MPTEFIVEESRLREADFYSQSGEVLRRLRVSLSGIIKNLPGRVRSNGDLQKLLGVDSKLCWQVMKVAGPGDPLQLAPFVPTPVPMRRLVRAAATKGISREQVDELTAAYQAFEDLVSTHAGDRSTFDTMATWGSPVGGAAEDDLQPAALAHRKAAFKANSHYCGMQLDTALVISMLHPSAHGDQFDIANIRSRFGMRRLRPDTDLIVDRFKRTITEHVDTEKDTHRHNCFNPRALELYGAPIIPEFSTSPLPELTTIHDDQGKSFTSLAGEAIGQLNAVDLTFGDLAANMPLGTLEDGRPTFGGAVGVNMPTLRVIVDHVVHRESFPNLTHRFSTHWQTTTADHSGMMRGPMLPFRERITRIEGGIDGARIIEVPNYPELMQFVCDHQKWNMEDFDVYRVRIDYPLIFTRLWLNFEGELPSKND